MKTFRINYSVGDSYPDTYYLYYDGIEDYDLIKESAIHEIKKNIKGTVGRKIKIGEIIEYLNPKH
jgi:hypothetical protein